MHDGFVYRGGMLSGLRRSAVWQGLATSQADWEDLESWSLGFSDSPYRGRGDLGEGDLLGFNYRGYGHVYIRLLRPVCPVIVARRIP